MVLGLLEGLRRTNCIFPICASQGTVQISTAAHEQEGKKLDVFTGQRVPEELLAGLYPPGPAGVWALFYPQ